MSRNYHIWRKIVSFLLILFLVEGSILLVDYFRSPKYSSQAKYIVVIDQDKRNDSVASINDTSQAASHFAELTAQIINTSSFVKDTYRRSGMIYTQEEIYENRDSVKAEVIKDTEIVELEVIDETPRKSKLLAQAVFDQLEEEISGDKWKDRSFSIELIDSPSEPIEPVSPQVGRDLIIGLVSVLILTSFYYLVWSDRN